MALKRSNNYANKFRSLGADRGLPGLGIGTNRVWGRVRSLSWGGRQISGHKHRAFLVTALAGTNNDLKFTAVTAGTQGNSIRVRYVVAGASTPLTVVTSAKDITVNVATNGSSAAISTAAQVRTALLADTAAARLIEVENATGNDGTGVVAALGYTNLAGGTDFQFDTPTLT